MKEYEKTEKRKKYVKEYWQRPEIRIKNQIYGKKWYKKNKKRILEYAKKYRELHKEEDRIRWYAKQFLRKKILKRDNYICQICNVVKTASELDIHHLRYRKNVNRKDKRDEHMKDLITVCRSCHKKIHLKN